MGMDDSRFYEWLYSEMMKQRGITKRDLAKHWGYRSTSVVTRLLRTIGDDEAKLYMFDEALSMITSERGGVYEASGATPDGIAEWQREMELAALDVV